MLRALVEVGLRRSRASTVGMEEVMRLAGILNVDRSLVLNRTLFLLCSFAICAFAVSCSGASNPGGDAGPDIPAVVIRCSPADDPDADSISTMDEGDGDPDADGLPNFRDTDSDGDGISDRDEAGRSNCTDATRDGDADGLPDFLDVDGNGDGLNDGLPGGANDTDRDGMPDNRDLDVDGDGIANRLEVVEGVRVDTDSDGVPDVLDDDSDADTIKDLDEGGSDQDRDGTFNFRDLDSDGDGVSDAIEAGDMDPATRPASCRAEINPLLPDRPVMPDGLADFLDLDSDNDGFGDRDEQVAGTNPCNVDTDGDGQDDLAEGTYVLVNCPDGSTGTNCDCARVRACVIPDSYFYMVLPLGGAPVVRDLDFGTTVRVADVFFVTDTTGSMGGTIDNVTSTVATPDTGIVAQIARTVPDVTVGAGRFDDFPFGSFGSPGSDEPFKLLIDQTPAAMSSRVQDAFASIRGNLGSGGDTPESPTEALYQIMRGIGGTFMSAANTYEMPAYGARCPERTYGAPCFRVGALPIIVLFTDQCSHNGPREEAGMCADYSGFTPSGATFDDAIRELNAKGTKFIGVNANAQSCGGSSAPNSPFNLAPCYFLNQVAQRTRSVDLRGNPLVYDLPNGADTTRFRDTVVGAIQTVTTRVRFDVDTATRDDPNDADGVNARRFIKEVVPGCNAEPAAAMCWSPPTGVVHTDAVRRTDSSTFFGVVPGTRVSFRVTFLNDFQPGGDRTKIYVAYIDVRGGGNAVLDTRQVYVVVPAGSDVPG